MFPKSSQKFITRVPESTAEEISDAVAAAVAAQPAWAAISANQRKRVLIDVIGILRQNACRIVSLNSSLGSKNPWSLTNMHIIFTAIYPKP